MLAFRCFLAALVGFSSVAIALIPAHPHRMQQKNGHQHKNVNAHWHVNLVSSQRFTDEYYELRQVEEEDPKVEEYSFSNLVHVMLTPANRLQNHAYSTPLDADGGVYAAQMFNEKSGSSFYFTGLPFCVRF